MNEKKYKHLTRQDRIEIQECLNKGMSFKDIGKRIEKDQTTEGWLYVCLAANIFLQTTKSTPRLQ